MKSLVEEIEIEGKSFIPLIEIVKILIPITETHRTTHFDPNAIDNREIEILHSTPNAKHVVGDTIEQFYRFKFTNSKVYEYDLFITSKYDIGISKHYKTNKTTSLLHLNNLFKVYMLLINWGLIEDLHLRLIEA